jgi:hypothetical protein
VTGANPNASQFGAAAGMPGAGAATGATSPFGNSMYQPTMVIGMKTQCKEPTVEFVIDGSGSMCEMFGGATRWTALRSALIDRQQGLIYKLQDRGDFGMLIYDGGIDQTASMMSTMTGPMQTCISPSTFMRLGDTTCPKLVEVAPARNNASMMDTMYPQRELGGSTPTDKAMNYEIDKLIAARGPNYDPMLHPQFIILATDGQPNDICMGGMGGDGMLQQANVIAAVDRAWAAGITTYVISMAGGDAGLEAHLTTVAQHGNPADPMAHSFSPMNPADLVMTLTMLLGAAFGCSVA